MTRDVKHVQEVCDRAAATATNDVDSEIVHATLRWVLDDTADDFLITQYLPEEDYKDDDG